MRAGKTYILGRDGAVVDETLLIDDLLFQLQDNADQAHVLAGRGIGPVVRRGAPVQNDVWCLVHDGGDQKLHVGRFLSFPASARRRLLRAGV